MILSLRCTRRQNRRASCKSVSILSILSTRSSQSSQSVLSIQSIQSVQLVSVVLVVLFRPLALPLAYAPRKVATSARPPPANQRAAARVFLARGLSVVLPPVALQLRLRRRRLPTLHCYCQSIHRLLLRHMGPDTDSDSDSGSILLSISSSSNCDARCSPPIVCATLRRALPQAAPWPPLGSIVVVSPPPTQSTLFSTICHRIITIVLPHAHAHAHLHYYRTLTSPLFLSPLRRR